MNIRISDKGEANTHMFDFVLRIQTQLSLSLDKDRMVHSSGPGPPYSHSTPPGDTMVSLLHVHKTHVDWQQPCKGKQLVHCCTTRTESTLLLLDMRYVNWLEAPFQHPGINFPGKAEQCPIIGAHPRFTFFKNGNHHPGLPHQRHCPRLPCNTEEACQSRQPNNVKSFQHVRVNFLHTWCLSAELLTTSETSARYMVRLTLSLQTLPPPQRMCWLVSGVPQSALSTTRQYPE